MESKLFLGLGCWLRLEPSDSHEGEYHLKDKQRVSNRRVRPVGETEMEKYATEVSALIDNGRDGSLEDLAGSKGDRTKIVM